MDLYYPLAIGSDRFRRGVLRIDAADDDAAAAEGRRIDGWRKTAYYTVRAIQTSTRSDDRLIFSSRVEETAPVEDTVIEVAPQRATSSPAPE
jgi:hypothetical protein